MPGPVVVDLVGLTVSETERKRLLNPYVGGVILFARNIGNYEQLLAVVAEIKAIRSDLLICVDQEGGRVQRCRDGFTRLPPMQVFDALYRENSTAALLKARDCGWLLAAEVLATGIDISFAPVLDVDDSFCSVIGDRAFSAEPEVVTTLAEAFIDGMHDAGMAVTGKHFPGHGSVRGDSHLELPIDERSKSEIEEKDLQPFKRLLPKLEALMPAHIIYPAWDTEQPVGYSALWLQDYLRQQLDYDGVLFSDDLTMEGAAKVGSYPARAEAALNAGCDVILVCNNPDGAEQVLESLLATGAMPKCPRLEKMRPQKKSMSRDELEATLRWQQTSQWLNALLEGGAAAMGDPTEAYLNSH